MAFGKCWEWGSGISLFFFIFPFFLPAFLNRLSLSHYIIITEKLGFSGILQLHWQEWDQIGCQVILQSSLTLISLTSRFFLQFLRFDKTTLKNIMNQKYLFADIQLHLNGKPCSTKWYQMCHLIIHPWSVGAPKKLINLFSLAESQIIM